MKDPKQMTAGEINRERDRIAKIHFPNLEKAYRTAGRDHNIATCYLTKNDALDAKMIALRARWYALQNEILHECGPGVMRFPKNFRRALMLRN